MKKIILGKGLEERVAKCSFCGEFQKECVKGSIPFIASYYEPITTTKIVIDD